MPDVEERIPIAETVQVDPEIAFAGSDQVARLEVPVDAGGLVFYGPGELLEDAALLFPDELQLLQGAHQLLPSVGEHFRIALGAK